MKKRKEDRVAGLVGGVFSLIGLVLLLIGIIVLVASIRFKQNAVEVPGVIAQIEVYRGTDDESEHQVYVTYEYGGRLYENVPISTYSGNMYEGKKITLYCDADNPGNCREGSMFFFVPILLMSMGACFAFVGVIFLLAFSGIGRAKKRKLMTTGQRLYAVVEQITVNESYTVNGRHPFLIYCTWNDSYRDVTYRFKSVNLWTDPEAVFPVGSTISVWVDPKDYSKYYVDAEEVERRIVDYT